MLRSQMPVWKKQQWRESWEQIHADEDKQKIRIEQHTFMGTVWLAGWLFTIGFLHLAFWKLYWRALQFAGALISRAPKGN